MPEMRNGSALLFGLTLALAAASTTSGAIADMLPANRILPRSQEVFRRVAARDAYLAVVVKQLNKNWTPPAGMKEEAIVTFSVDHLGGLSPVVFNHSTGSKDIDAKLLAYIKGWKAPMPPRDAVKMNLSIRFNPKKNGVESAI